MTPRTLIPERSGQRCTRHSGTLPRAACNLENGDIAVQGGPACFVYHGVAPFTERVFRALLSSYITTAPMDSWKVIQS